MGARRDSDHPHYYRSPVDLLVYLVLFACCIASLQELHLLFNNHARRAGLGLVLYKSHHVTKLGNP